MSLMTEQTDAKYNVPVRLAEKAIRVPKELVTNLKGAAGGKLLARMKKEALDCPVTVSYTHLTLPTIYSV